MEGLGWEASVAEEYVDLLVELAEAAGGGVVEPSTTVTDCPDHEDNRILELALASQALLIVSTDTDLLALSPWRGTPVVSPREFAGRVDVMRRGRRRP